MATQFLLLVPLFGLYHYGILNLPMIMGIILFIYWIPKFFFVKLLEICCPYVITRNPTHNYNYRNIGNVALTFDDMPYGSHQEIIDILDKYNMKATLFIVSGDITESNIDIFINAVRNGHQLGNHGRTNSMHFLKNREELIDEIEHCDRKIKEIYLKANVPLPTVMCYRPGCGLFGPQMLDILLSLESKINTKYTLTLGSVYPDDPVIPFSLVHYYYNIWHIEEGDVIIIHDRSWTPKMLRYLLAWMVCQNLRSVTIDTLFNH
jgi:peptidoglycan/xylan/chitin deacetylase (PgdA/CDA1 family)